MNESKGKDEEKDGAEKKKDEMLPKKPKPGILFIYSYNINVLHGPIS